LATGAASEQEAVLAERVSPARGVERLFAPPLGQTTLCLADYRDRMPVNRSLAFR
jgi:hypothetical protein